ncbi:DUF4190 domain-containing protein [Nocardioides sp. R1-1]|uniref:DUF4190 domain-containing protein n=1 Tax=Nocardioides sp. R1-1 TaxID=3383502 RepID=UPI0038CFC77A
MSDPYGQNPSGQNPSGQNPSGANPYGQPPTGQSPYGQPPAPPAPPSPYASGAGSGYGPPGSFPGGSDPMPPKTDGISIAALVTSLLCCLAPVGVILGFVGLSRTKGGQRKGRGLAIAGIVIGLLMSITSAVVGAAVFIFAESLVPLDDAEVGQCVDIDEEGDAVIMREKKCSEEHDGEIVGTTEVTDENVDTVKGDMAGFCASLVSDEDMAKLNEVSGLQYKAVIEDPEDIGVGDHLVCYVEGEDELTEPIL